MASTVPRSERSSSPTSSSPATRVPESESSPSLVPQTSSSLNSHQLSSLDSFPDARARDDRAEDVAEFASVAPAPTSATPGFSVAATKHLKPVPRLMGYSKMESYKRGGASSYLTYIFLVTAESRASSSWYVRKRYSQFDRLLKDLRSECFWSTKIPKLPGKTYFGTRIDDAFARERALGLSTFLWKIAAAPELSESAALREFLLTDKIDETVLPDMLPVTPSLASLSQSPALEASRVPLLNAHTPYSLAARSPGSPHSVDSSVVTRLALEQLATPSTGHLFLPSATTAQGLRQTFVDEGLGDFEDADLNESEVLEAEASSLVSCSFLGFGGSKRRAPPPVLTPRFSDLGRGLNFAESPQLTFRARATPVPKLRIVILLVGSRGDVQPYIALGKGLMRRGHNVRIAAHAEFKDWIVNKHGLDYAPIAGDPKELLKMVAENNLFSYSFVKTGFVKHRQWVSEVLRDAWRACTRSDPYVPEPGEETEFDPDEGETGPGVAFSALNSKYRADMVIANPPSFAGWHIAEALGIPLCLSFPMPWTRTKYFPSPFTHMGASKPDSSSELNWLTFGAVDRMIWLGLGDLINAWRKHTLRLHPIFTYSAKGHRYTHDYKTPVLYPWSSAVLPRPRDWGEHVQVCGYMFLPDSDGSEWRPPIELERFLTESTKPVLFVGFGSIALVEHERLRLVEIVTSAATHFAMNGCRVLIQSGWAGITMPENLTEEVSQNVLVIGPAPHKYLFQKCAVVAHHGGAGTTAESLLQGKPTVIVPFFGDQFFWGDTVRNRGLGDTCPFYALTTERFVEMMLAALSPKVGEACIQVARAMASEPDGVELACDFLERRVFPEHFLTDDPSVIEVADLNDEDSDWRSNPFFDLKRAVKIKRDENIHGARKLKKRLKTIVSMVTGSGAEGAVKLSYHSLPSQGTGSMSSMPLEQHQEEQQHEEHHHHHHHQQQQPQQRRNGLGLEMNRLATTKRVMFDESDDLEVSSESHPVGNSSSLSLDETRPFTPVRRMGPTRLPSPSPSSGALATSLPMGHTKYTWWGDDAFQTLPMGHTGYSWGRTSTGPPQSSGR